MPLSPRHVLAAAGAFLALTACDPLPGGGQAAPAPSTPPPATPATATTAAAPPPPAATPLNPSGPDLQLYTLPECSLAPDTLTVFVAVRNGGPGQHQGLVPWEMSSDTGLRTSGSSAISTGSSFTAMPVTVRSSDFRRTHRFTVRADPANRIVERSETNNTLSVTVTLPARPAGATDVSCTSP